MATITEFVILATGWRYQKLVCLPQGMGVTFFGIGPIGATILAVELLKLPLAIWTASRHGWQKFMMVSIGLPLICLLTFQLVKDMAVYEMGVALTPANKFLEQAQAEEVKIGQLSGELTRIEQMKTDRQNKLAELSNQEAKAKADIEDALKRNDESRKDAVDLTDYQRSQLSEVDAREAAITKQFESDTAEINKTLADLRASRETELARDAKWNEEEARIDNEYKTKLADYQNRKAQFDREKAAYDSANVVKRQFMKEPVDPGVPPVRASNTLLKSTVLTELDNEIKAKEDELQSVDATRRERVAQVEEDARQLRQQFQGRSGTRRDQADTDRAALLAAEAKLDTEYQAQRKQVDDELAAAMQKVDGLQAEVDASRKRAEGFYEQREAAIRATQVNRIATTVEIVREMIKHEHPASIKASAKERGDILTDQISMVRVWVYPVLAFIVAFLPTLMVEVGFSTVFEPEKTRPPYRVGFLGRGLHLLYKRAGHFKMLRYERMAREATARLSKHDEALALEKAAVKKELDDKDARLHAVEESLANAAAEHEQKLRQIQDEHAAQVAEKEQAWTAKLAKVTESLNRAVVEKDSLRDLQKFEVERQVQLRQGAWSDQLKQLRHELEEQRAASQREREALMEEQRKKLVEVTEDCRSQIMQVRRQAADAEKAAADNVAKMQHELTRAIHDRDAMEAQLKQQADSVAVARDKTMLLQEQELEHRLKQREQELTLAFESRLAEARARVEQDARRREADLERQIEARAQEIDARRKQELSQNEESFLFKLKQREQQLQAQFETRVAEVQAEAQQEARRREAEFERQLEAQARDAAARLKQDLQQKELVFEARLKHREQELTARAAARETELQNKWTAELRIREEEWQRQAEARLQATEARLAEEALQKEEMLLAKARQREKQLQAKLDNMRAEWQGAHEEAARRRGREVEAVLGELESQLRKEIRVSGRDGVLDPALAKKS